MPPKPRKPWFRKGRGYFITYQGRQYDLEVYNKADREQAWDAFYDFLANPPAPILETGQLEVLGTNSPAVEVFGRFLLDLEKTSEPSTLKWYERYIKSFSKRIKLIPLSDIRPELVTDWLSRDYAAKSWRGPIRAIKKAIHWAMAQGWLEADPLRTLKMPSQGRRKGVLSLEQRQIIRLEARGDEFGDLLTALEQTGARIQEIRKVEARHFDESRGAWVFPPLEHKTGRTTGQPKIIPLTGEMIELTKRLARAHKKGPLFRNSRGEPWTKTAVRDRFRRMKARADGLLPNLCATHFRHSMATDLIKAGTNLEIVRQILGHQGFEVLAKHYLHEQPVDAMRAAIESTRNVVPPPTTQTQPSSSVSSVSQPKNQKGAKPPSPADQRQKRASASRKPSKGSGPSK